MMLEFPIDILLVALRAYAEIMWLTTVPVFVIEEDDMFSIFAFFDAILEEERVGMKAFDKLTRVSTRIPPFTCIMTEEGTWLFAPTLNGP